MPRHLHLSPQPDLDPGLLQSALERVGLVPSSLEAAAQAAGLAGDLRPGEARAWAQAAPLSAAARHRALALLDALARAANAPPAGELARGLRCALALDLLEVTSVTCDPLPVPSGASAAPPSPAVLAILAGSPVRGVEVDHEPVSAVGAALAVAFSETFGPLPTLTLDRVGTADAGRLLVYLGRRVPPPSPLDDLLVLETNLDDLSAEVLATLPGVCLEAGALDAWLTPALMKKGRPGHCLHALCSPAAAGGVERSIFCHSSALGVRRVRVERTALERTWHDAPTPWGPVRVKLGWLDGAVVNRAPEFEDCRRVAEAAGVPLKEVYATALAPQRR